MGPYPTFDSAIFVGKFSLGWIDAREVRRFPCRHRIRGGLSVSWISERFLLSKVISKIFRSRVFVGSNFSIGGVPSLFAAIGGILVPAFEIVRTD